MAEFPECAPECAKRVRRVNSMLANYVIDCTLPSATQTVSTSLKENVRRVFVSIFDEVIQERDSRFNERSMEFVHSLVALIPNHDNKFLSLEHLNAFVSLVEQRLVRNDLKQELPKQVMPTVTLRCDNHGIMQVHDFQESLYQYKEAFPQT